jgi:hypothetical protein
MKITRQDRHLATLIDVARAASSPSMVGHGPLDDAVPPVKLIVRETRCPA